MGAVSRVQLFESPPLMRKDCDRPPDKRPEIWCAVERAGVGWGSSCGAGNRGNVDLQSFTGSGKFEKLLRSDPRPIGCGGAGCVCCLRTQ